LYLETTMTVDLTFKDALHIDMERKGLSEATLGKALGISQQAVHKWLERGFPPLSRLDTLLEVLGPGSEVSKLSRDRLYSSRSRTVVSVPVDRPARFSSEKYADIMEYAKRQTLNFVNMLPLDLAVNAHRVVKMGEATVRFDYLSSKLAVELLVVSGDATDRNTSAAMLKLVTFQKGQNDPMPVLLVISKEDRPLPPMTIHAARSFGITVQRAANGVEAARWVADAEGVSGNGYSYLLEPDE